MVDYLVTFLMCWMLFGLFIMAYLMMTDSSFMKDVPFFGYFVALIMLPPVMLAAFFYMLIHGPKPRD